MIDLCPGDDLQIYPFEADGWNVLDDPWTFHELTKFGSSHDKFDVLPRPY